MPNFWGSFTNWSCGFGGGGALWGNPSCDYATNWWAALVGWSTVQLVVTLLVGAIMALWLASMFGGMILSAFRK